MASIINCSSSINDITVSFTAETVSGNELQKTDQELLAIDMAITAAQLSRQLDKGFGFSRQRPNKDCRRWECKVSNGHITIDLTMKIEFADSKVNSDNDSPKPIGELIDQPIEFNYANIWAKDAFDSMISSLICHLTHIEQG